MTDKKQRFTETGKKGHDPQEKANALKSEDNVGTSDEAQHSPDYPHPEETPEGKKSGGSDD